MNFARISNEDALILTKEEDKLRKKQYNIIMQEDERIEKLKEYLYSRKLSAHTVKDIVWKVKELFL